MQIRSNHCGFAEGVTMNTGNRKLTRRTGLAALALLASPALLLAGAAPDLAGDWQGKLNVNPTTAITVRFTFTKAANGTYNAVVNSPDNSAVKNTPVNNVTFDGTNLKFAVPSLQGSYAGKLAGGKFAGQWTQPTGALPLELAPYQKVALSADAIKPYLGDWNTKITLAAQSQMLAFNFRQGAGGLEGTFSIPDQGVNRPMTDVTLENGELSFKTNVGAELSFKGKLAGNGIVGKLKVPSPAAPPDGLDVTLQKGAYAPPPVALKLSAESFAKVKGRWQARGEVTNPQNGQKIAFTTVMRFENGAKAGEYFGFTDSERQVAPGQTITSKGVIINDATLTGDKLTFRVASAQAEFTGTLAGNKITGELSQGGQRIPMEFTRTP
jgi:hypothetical protein